jgi:hypothetical protein
MVGVNVTHPGVSRVQVPTRNAKLLKFVEEMQAKLKPDHIIW